MTEDLNNKDRLLKSEILAAELFEAISHPTRIRILKSVRKNPLGFSQLKNQLGFSSSGNLTHHLRKLGTLIQTNAHGSYILTDQGYESIITIDKILGSENKIMRNDKLLIVTLFFYSTLLTVGTIMTVLFGNEPLEILISTLAAIIPFYVVMRASFKVNLKNEKMKNSNTNDN